MPKQFCSFNGGMSLLSQTLKRAAAVVAHERVTTIVAANHARHWQSSLAALPPSNVVVQPADRGTAIGILLPALRIARRSPNARIIILPSDHYVADEQVLEIAMRRALAQIAHHSRGVALLGIEAEEPDPELGYVVPALGTRAGFSNVLRFVEKPPADEARRLWENGALWNSFILVCRIDSLINLYMLGCAGVVERLQDTDLDDPAEVYEVYRTLPSIDFSREIAAGQEEQLAVASVSPCGWSDLGSPRRLALALRRQRKAMRVSARPNSVAGDHIDLAERLLEAHPNYAADLLTNRA